MGTVDYRVQRTVIRVIEEGLKNGQAGLFRGVEDTAEPVGLVAETAERTTSTVSLHATRYGRIAVMARWGVEGVSPGRLRL